MLIGTPSMCWINSHIIMALPSGVLVFLVFVTYLGRMQLRKATDISIFFLNSELDNI